MSRTLALTFLLAAAFAQAAYAASATCTCTGCGQCPTIFQVPCEENGGTFQCGSDSTSGTCSGASAECSTFDADCAEACTAASCTGHSGSCGSSPCFPANATVELEDGSIKTMAALATGDRVLVGANVYSDVYMFSHSDADSETQFVQITTDESHTLLLSPGHYLYVNGKLATAKTVRAGSQVTDARGNQVAVTGVSFVRSSGLYNPHTMQGDVVVNGIKTSTYTDAIAPALAHAALWPVRMAYMLGQDVVGGAFAQGSELIANALPNGKEAY